MSGRWMYSKYLTLLETVICKLCPPKFPFIFLGPVLISVSKLVIRSRYAGDLISRPIRFTRNVSLVSVSMDGVQIPQPYVHG
jgi:hypothetical protein